MLLAVNRCGAKRYRRRSGRQTRDAASPGVQSFELSLNFHFPDRNLAYGENAIVADSNAQKDRFRACQLI
jgi:hypothetical protein